MDTDLRMDTNLRSLEAEIEFLPELAKGWKDEPLSNQLDWQWEWADLMGRLEVLHDAYMSGKLSAEQAGRYQALVPRLEQVLHIAERLGLPVYHPYRPRRDLI